MAGEDRFDEWFWDLCDLTDFNLRSPMRRRGRERERDQGGVSDHVDDPH